MKEKLVSVYIPTCNRLEMLKRAIHSVLLQDYKNIEILTSKFKCFEVFIYF